MALFIFRIAIAVVRSRWVHESREVVGSFADWSGYAACSVGNRGNLWVNSLQRHAFQT